MKKLMPILKVRLEYELIVFSLKVSLLTSVAKPRDAIPWAPIDWIILISSIIALISRELFLLKKE